MRKIIFIISLVLTISTTYVCVSHAAKNVGAYWSGFESSEGLNDSAAGYLVVDAVDAKNGTIGDHDKEEDSSIADEDVVFEEGEEGENAPASAQAPKVWLEIRVAAGETTSQIAEKNGISVKDIMIANELTDQHKLRENQKLFIPISSDYVLNTLDHVRQLKRDEVARKKQAKRVEVTDYVVKEGDTLWSIAAKFNLDVNTIFGCNKLADANVLKLGTVIRVPNQDGIFIKTKAGQTLNKLADEYGTFVEAIASANDFGQNETLVAGKEIFLPGAKVDAFVETGGNSNAVAVKNKMAARLSFGWPVVGKMGSSFGWRRDPFHGRRAYHTGIDIRAPRGRPIVAAAAGKVVFSGWMGGYGRAIVISHPGGMTTIYGHCSKLLVNSGHSVRRGQRIALIGSSGRATGNHVHFEVRKNGTAVNPLRYIR